MLYFKIRWEWLCHKWKLCFAFIWDKRVECESHRMHLYSFKRRLQCGRNESTSVFLFLWIWSSEVFKTQLKTSFKVVIYGRKRRHTIITNVDDWASLFVWIAVADKNCADKWPRRLVIAGATNMHFHSRHVLSNDKLMRFCSIVALIIIFYRLDAPANRRLYWRRSRIICQFWSIWRSH